MNIAEIRKWAIEYNLEDVPNRKDVPRANTYIKDMIPERCRLVIEYTAKMQGYIDDIQEFLGEVGKLGIKVKEAPTSIPEREEPIHDVNPLEPLVKPLEDKDYGSNSKEDSIVPGL